MRLLELKRGAISVSEQRRHSNVTPLKEQRSSALPAHLLALMHFMSLYSNEVTMLVCLGFLLTCARQISAELSQNFL